MSGPDLTIGPRVIAEMVELAALQIPGVARVGRRGPRWRAALSGRPIVTHISPDGVRVRVWLVARPGQPLASVAADVRAAVGGAIERLLGLRLKSVVVTVDGIGG